MSDQNAKQEPSMEEILASIRRIISEGEGEETSPATDQVPDDQTGQTEDESNDDDVLELTNMVDEDGGGDENRGEQDRVKEPKAAPPENAGSSRPLTDELEAGMEDDLAAQQTAIQNEMDEEAEIPAARDKAGNDEALISDQPAAQSVNALSSLSQALSAGETHAIDDRTGIGGRSVEDLAKELLRPMLRDWLDQNLPPLVERLVQKEIRRLVRRSEDF